MNTHQKRIEMNSTKILFFLAFSCLHVFAEDLCEDTEIARELDNKCSQEFEDEEDSTSSDLEKYFKCIREGLDWYDENDNVDDGKVLAEMGRILIVNDPQKKEEFDAAITACLQDEDYVNSRSKETVEPLFHCILAAQYNACM